jgi:hypothetical protein
MQDPGRAQESWDFNIVLRRPPVTGTHFLSCEDSTVEARGMVDPPLNTL